MKSRLRSLFFLLAIVLVVGCDSGSSNPMIGKPAPDFRVSPVVPGGDVKLSGLKGKVVLLDFWATWCGPCIQFMPVISGLQEKYRDKGFVVLGISGEELAAVQAFRKDHPQITHSLYLDHIGEAGSAYHADSLPTAVLIGKDGKVISWEAGFGPNTAQDLDEAIQSALSAS